METIRAAALRLAAAAGSPSRVIVFGSYGRGTASENSDLDLMVVEQNLPAVLTTSRASPAAPCAQGRRRLSVYAHDLPAGQTPRLPAGLAEGRERFELLVGAAALANNLMIIARLLLSKRRQHAWAAP